MVNLNTTLKDQALINQIARRSKPFFKEARIQRMTLNIGMDIAAVHLNGCPLDLERLMAFGDIDFAHDVLEINRHIDRATGKLKHGFVPRCALVMAEQPA